MAKYSSASCHKTVTTWRKRRFGIFNMHVSRSQNWFHLLKLVFTCTLHFAKTKYLDKYNGHLNSGTEMTDTLKWLFKFVHGHINGQYSLIFHKLNTPRDNFTCLLCSQT